MKSSDFVWDTHTRPGYQDLMYRGRYCIPIPRPNPGSRRVFSMPGGTHVVKFSKGGVQSRMEWAVYPTIAEEHKRYFPKLVTLFQDGNKGVFLVEERLFLRYGKVSKHAVNLVRDLQRKYSIGDLIVRDWGRRVEERDNWAINGDTNEPVIFDFGL